MINFMRLGMPMQQPFMGGTAYPVMPHPIFGAQPPTFGGHPPIFGGQPPMYGHPMQFPVAPQPMPVQGGPVYPAQQGMYGNLSALGGMRRTSGPQY